VSRRRWKDVLEPDLDVVFVGYNPSRLAWQTGHHYANPGNRFYHLLHDAGLTPRRFAPAECRDLLRLGIGLADVLHTWSPRADDFPPAAYRKALPPFRARLARAAPRAVMLNGIGLYRLLFDRAPPRLGREPDVRLGRAVVFVAPSSSGLANGHSSARRAAYGELARWLHSGVGT
jgi:TDG/mug DNA glycosylase family protein